MLRFARAAAAGLAALTLSAFQAVPPQLPPELAALAGDAEAARAFDYMALKAEGADLGAFPDAIHIAARGRCLTAGESELQMGLSAALAAPDAVSFEADKVAAAEALTLWDAYAERLASGFQEPEQPFASVARLVPRHGARRDGARA